MYKKHDILTCVIVKNNYYYNYMKLIFRNDHRFILLLEVLWAKENEVEMGEDGCKLQTSVYKISPENVMHSVLTIVNNTKKGEKNMN